MTKRHPSKHTKPHEIEYRVAWDQVQARFAVYRQTERTPHFSPVRNVAVALAIQDADREATASGKKIIVTSMRNGKRILEWDGITPL